MNTGNLEVSDNLGDVGVHLVKLGVFGGSLPVLAPSHRVHNVLGEKGMKSLVNQPDYCLHTNLDESQVGDHPNAVPGPHLAPRQLELEVGQLCPSELEGEPQQGGGQGSLGLGGEGGCAADPGVGALLLGDGGEVAQQQQVLVVGHLPVSCLHPWAQLQLLLGRVKEFNAKILKMKATLSPARWRASRMASRLSSFSTL